MIPALLLAAGAPAQAQALHAGSPDVGLAFPAPRAGHEAFYPTAYLDHLGADWNCGGFTYPGHRGSDFGAGGFAGMDEGRIISAAAPGVVVATNDGELDRCTTGDCPGGAGFGNFVVVQHADGQRTIYAHLAQWSVSVAVGDDVMCGQSLGRLGSSGYSTGPHLHFELRGPDDVALDPFAGACGATRSAWIEQGGYDGLPAPECGAAPTCEPATTLSCGQRVTAANDDPGSTSATWHYGCSEWAYSGPELSFTFATELSEPVHLKLDGLTADLDLYVLDSPACDGSGCVAAASNPSVEAEEVTFEAEARRTYVVVVDGWEGATSEFALEVACEGTDEPPLPTGDTGEPVSPGGPVSPPMPMGPDQGASCGCAVPTTGPPAAPLWLWVACTLAALGALGARRAPAK
jgi:murein DD-endopeptidase MepM/ murein hydrolase activator NlpD